MKARLTLCALLATQSLTLISCGFFPKQLSPRDAAEHIVTGLRATQDEKMRATATAFSLNTMCTLSRLARGSADGRVEQALAGFIDRQPEPIKAQLSRFSDTLAEIPTQTRQELLGNFSAFDPGVCSTAPQWDRLRRSIIFNHRLIPRLRANFCSGNFNYSDGASGQRAITVASQLEIMPNPDGGPSFFNYKPASSPVILGVEGQFVSARHPALAATATSGEGIMPFGLPTTIPCSTADESACDASQGLICSTKLQGGSTGGAWPTRS
jgi:hypothetical protein